MPLLDPPPPATLAGLPAVSLRGRVLHRVFSSGRSSPWWFASTRPGDDPDEHGRFDLPAPSGSCYLAESAAGAVLEALQDFTGLLPDAELARRRRAVVTVPRTAPRAAGLASRAARGAGVTAELWAGRARGLTQAWAAALHRAGWRALSHGISHDPTGAQRAVTLFDDAGEHAPYDDAEGWSVSTHTLHDDLGLHRELATYGITVTRSDPQLPVLTSWDPGA